jgi:uncharacterized lipoprotein YajG
MKLILKASLLFFCCLGLSACAYVPQTARLEPNVNIAESNEGNGAAVSVKVIDERPDNVIGHRGAAALAKGAAINITQDLETLVQTEILKGLAKKGFKPFSCSADEKPVLKVEIRLLEYYTSTGFWTGGVHTKAAIKAIAYVNGKTYENFYRVANEKRVMLVPTADANEKLINEILNDILKKLLDDSQLISFLAEAR